MKENVNSDTAEQISGEVEKITYKNDRDGYTVAVVKCGGESVTVVGLLPFLSEGDSAIFYGSYTVHSTYGRQFSAKTFERSAPGNSAAILRYLSSGAIKGIGPSTARKIVEKFGVKALDIIKDSPNELSSIRGISEDKAVSISESYKKQYGVRDIMMLLSPFDVSLEKCIKIFKIFGNTSCEIIKNNPYALCDDAIGVSFEKAEMIAQDLDFSTDSEMRLSAGIEYILKRNLSNGHTCLPRVKLNAVAVGLLQSDEMRIDTVIDRMVASLCVVSKRVDDTEFIALKKYVSSEEYISARMLAAKRATSGFREIEDIEIDLIEKRISIEFEEIQRFAIKQTFANGVMLITGGPGTGKTTLLNAIIELFERQGSYIELAAPTGRAAKRMTELTGCEAKTVHRLLEVDFTAEDEQSFSRNEKNPLECDVIIVDEASMLDTLLFENLLRALRFSCKIILVGDADQLPSVSAGNVFGDLLASGCFETIRLKKVFRQSSRSMIVTNAHAIIDGEKADLSNKGDDFFMLRRGSTSDTCNTVLELCIDRLPATYNFNPLTDIQVLCPSKKFDCGTLNLNNLLQSCLNPKRKGTAQLSYKGVNYRVGDKVMQIKNNYDIEWKRENGETGYGVFNGDIGYITDIDLRAGFITVRFEDRSVMYLDESVGELELAYAITVHKSQGSEFECVIIPLYDIPDKLKYRNLLYTAVTRAKKMLILVGSEEVFRQMQHNDRKTLRYTLLKDILNDNCY